MAETAESVTDDQHPLVAVPIVTHGHEFFNSADDPMFVGNNENLGASLVARVFSFINLPGDSYTLSLPPHQNLLLCSFLNHSILHIAPSFARLRLCPLFAAVAATIRGQRTSVGLRHNTGISTDWSADEQSILDELEWIGKHALAIFILAACNIVPIVLLGVYWTEPQSNIVMASKTKIYIVLDFVDGGELFDKIANHGRLKEEEARRYFQQDKKLLDGIILTSRKNFNLLYSKQTKRKAYFDLTSIFANKTGSRIT
ncbi:hypothetical protein QQ045_028905 [Rhodiola kirilowii]